MENKLITFSSETYQETDLKLLLKNMLDEDHTQNQEENNRLKRLLQEGKIDTVCQIISHRKAVACIKKPLKT